jgi:hypothetical protein
LHHKASWFLDQRGRPLPVPDELTAAAKVFVREAAGQAAWISREAHRRGIR